METIPRRIGKYLKASYAIYSVAVPSDSGLSVDLMAVGKPAKTSLASDDLAAKKTIKPLKTNRLRP